MKIIGFGCTAQCGKDTAADYLESVYPGKVKKVSFAKAVKTTTMSLFNLSYDQCYGSQNLKESVDLRYKQSPREIMQGVGSKMRDISPNVWIDLVFNSTIPKLEEQGFTCAVISDVRYPNEAHRIKELGGIVVKIDRSGSGVTVGKQHASETSLLNYNGFDYVVDNNSSLESFFEKINIIALSVLESGVNVAS